jgi:hypothetical protein
MSMYSSSDLAPLTRLVEIAKDNTGQSERVASFLLAWWNARQHGGFDLTDLWSLDGAIVTDMVSVFKLIADARSYPDAFGLETDIQTIISDWRCSQRG